MFVRGHFSIANPFELVCHRIDACHRTKDLAHNKHALVTKSLLPHADEKGAQDGRRPEHRVHIPVNLISPKQPKNMQRNWGQHRCNGAITHEWKTDNYRVLPAARIRPMDPHHHRELDQKDDCVHWFKRIVVEQWGPKNLKTPIEQSAKRANPSQRSVVNSSNVSKLLVWVCHVVAVEEMTDA